MGSAPPLAEFDEALAVQGFYTRVQRERSDKALDLFDQELREPPGFRNWKHSEFWKPGECSPRRTTTHQAKPQMDSTGPDSKPSDSNDYRDQVEEEFKTPIRKGTEGLRKAITAIVADPPS